MRKQWLWVGLIWLWVVGGCNFPAPQAVSPTPTAQPSATNVPPTLTPLPPTVTLLPDGLATFTATATPDVPIAWPKDQPVNCRFGPGVMYAVMSALNPGQVAPIAGKNAEGTWWYLHDPGRPGEFCWVAMSVTNAAGNLEALPVVPPPHVSVTDLRLQVEPVSASIDCNAFPYTFSVRGEMTTNGPAAVTWQWEWSTGEASAPKTLLFAEAGTQAVQNVYQVNGPGDYWARLHVLSPNEMSQQVEFRMSCTP